ncbi:MAG TPA: DUF4331 domain-containing protein [Pyrinomonadaceae bacterium]|nr:DUF4331 domain-containing protein [Pyrinomonadaceae bacterium]
MKKVLLEKSLKMTRIFFVLTMCFGLSGLPSFASSHAEAPLISMDRYADNTDVYAFRSTEAGRDGFVTILANFIPLQGPSDGPQFFRFDDSVLYEIKIDNTGDGLEDITYQFQFTTQIVNPRTVLGMSTINLDGQITSLTDVDYNMPQTYTVTRVDQTSGRRGRFLTGGLLTPPSNIGPRVTPNYEANLAQPAIYPLPNGGRVFAGQRDEGFFLDLGVFDAINYRSLAPTGGVDTLRTRNVSTIAIEVPIQDLTRSRAVPANSLAADAVIGIFSTASRRGTRVIQPDGTRNTEGAWRQISRLGSPLINEVVVPLGLKDAFNSLPPRLDGTVQPVVDAVLDPEFPKIIRLALGRYGTFNGSGVAINIPPAPRNDIAQIFVFGIPVNAATGPTFTTVIQGNDGQPHEMLRLNTAIPVTPAATASRLGILGMDLGGFPNGRRVFDDVVDIEVRALLGGTPFTPAFNIAPNNAFNDGVSANCEGFLTRFPYLQTPNQGNQPRLTDFPASQTFPAATPCGGNF